jgi:hypothetical protein
MYAVNCKIPISDFKVAVGIFPLKTIFLCVNRLLIAFKFVIRSIENFSIAIGLYACGIAFSFDSPYYVHLILHDGRIVTSC